MILLDAMNETLNYILKKYEVSVETDSPIMLPDTREDLSKLLHELEFKTGAEIGVSSGNYSRVLCENNNLSMLYCVDSWTTTKGYTEEGKGEHTMVKRYETAKAQLEKYPCKLIRKTSMEAVTDFANNSLDFVYIDADHTFDYVMQDVIAWTKVVKPGGIVAGHDYRCFHHDEISQQVSKAILLYTQIHNIKPLFVFDADHSSSWMFVK